jgi:hypothetical protein
MPDMQTLPFLMNQIVIHVNNEAVLPSLRRMMKVITKEESSATKT